MAADRAKAPLEQPSRGIWAPLALPGSQQQQAHSVRGCRTPVRWRSHLPLWTKGKTPFLLLQLLMFPIAILLPIVIQLKLHCPNKRPCPTGELTIRIESRSLRCSMNPLLSLRAHCSPRHHRRLNGTVPTRRLSPTPAMEGMPIRGGCGDMPERRSFQPRRMMNKTPTALRETQNWTQPKEDARSNNLTMGCFTP